MRNDKHGNPVPFHLQAEATAEYLSSVHWGLDGIDEIEAGIPKTDPLPQPQRPCHPLSLFANQPLFDTGDITIHELYASIHHHLKKKNDPARTATSPRHSALSLTKPCPFSLPALTAWWRTKRIPPDVSHAKVIGIYKKGNPKQSRKLPPYIPSEHHLQTLPYHSP